MQSFWNVGNESNVALDWSYFIFRRMECCKATWTLNRFPFKLFQIMINTIRTSIVRIAERSCANLNSTGTRNWCHGNQWCVCLCVCARDFSRHRILSDDEIQNAISRCSIRWNGPPIAAPTDKCHFCIRRCWVVCEQFQASSIRIHFTSSKYGTYIS